MTSTITPEFAVPGLIRIFAALVYDTLLLAAISIAYGAVVVGLHVALVGQPPAGQRIQWGLTAGVAITLGWFLVLLCFYVYFWHRFGQTLGMKTWRIQVLDAQTLQLPSYSQSVIRAFVGVIGLVCAGMGYWYALINPQQRLLHDQIAGTRLVILKKK